LNDPAMEDGAVPDVVLGADASQMQSYPGTAKEWQGSLADEASHSRPQR